MGKIGHEKSSTFFILITQKFVYFFRFSQENHKKIPKKILSGERSFKKIYTPALDIVVELPGSIPSLDS